MRMSYSRVSSFESCPYKWKLHYIDGVETIPDFGPQNALTLGTCMHKGCEEDLEAALDLYKKSLLIYSDKAVDEEIKFCHWIPLLHKLPEGLHEVELNDPGKFLGFIDLLVPVGDGLYDIYDYKYTSESGVKRYKASPQLSIYKYYFETLEMGKVRDLYFVFIPKITIRQKKTEDLYQFRERLREMLNSRELEVWKSEYDPGAVLTFFEECAKIENTAYFPKVEGPLCNWCEYEGFCRKGDDSMIIPKNERRKATKVLEPDMWIYGDSYSGKTTFADSFDDVLFLNTDGNIDNVTNPVIRITDTMEGRIRKSAWQNFLDTIGELEKQHAQGEENDFKIVAIDLLEDMFEHCRKFVFARENIKHESDSGYGKGWDMVSLEFNSTIKRLKNIGYRVFYLSKEKKDVINLRGGATVTAYKPNLRESVANVMAGTVGLTVRVFAEGEKRYMKLQPDEYVFGGGRFNFKKDIIELNKKKFQEALSEAQDDLAVPDRSKPEPKPEPKVEPNPKPESGQEEEPAPWEPKEALEPKPAPEPDAQPAEVEKRVRRRRAREE